jgi:thiamine-monophosphate kinase
MASEQTVSEVGEFGLIDRIRAALPAHGAAVVGPGDDAAVLDLTGRVLVSTDMLLEGRHFRRDWVEAVDVGHRAAARSLADLSAMGGTTTALTVGLGVPGDLPVAWVLDLVSGMVEEAALVGAEIVGGDVTRSDSVVIAVTAVGTCAGPPVLRSGARAGDQVALTGRLGWAAAGLAVLGRGFRSPRAVVEAYRRPSPPYAAGPQALDAGATALVDVSDGLLADLGHVASASGVHIDIDPSSLGEIPEPLAAVAAAVGADALSFVLTGGDDHALAATFPQGSVPDGWAVIGRVLEGAGITVSGESYDGPAGHDHFA